MPKQPNHQPIHQAAEDLTEQPAEPPDHSGQSGGSGRSGVTVGRQCDAFTILTITAGTTGTGPRQYECANEGDPSGRESGNRLRPGPSPTDPAETGRARDREVEARSRWNA